MTAAVYRSGTPSLSVPETQNTAPVLEFNCLYTHDVRRKQKRWQDGFLRFHTFNKRIMVYDVPRNLVGDVHWKADGVLQDGDEVTLERDGVLVQVAESIGSTETDLTELRRSKKKKSSEAGSSSPARPAPPQRVALVAGSKAQPVTQLKHRSLNALLGTPKGPIGKAALPSKSPFEERHANIENEDWNSDRPSKRVRRDEPPLWNVTRTTTTAKPVSNKQAPVRAPCLDAAKRRKAPLGSGQKKLGTREIVDLSVDDEDSVKFLAGFSSDALVPTSSPQKENPPSKDAVPVRSSSPAFQTQKVPENVTRPAMPQREQPPSEDRTPARSSSAVFQTKRVPGKNPRQAEVVDKPRQVDTTREQKSYEHRETKSDKVVALKALTKVQPAPQPPNPVKRPVDPLNGYLTQPPKENEDAQFRMSDSPVRPASRSGKTLRMDASAPKRKTLLCQQQASKPLSRVHSANTESAIDALLDVATQESPSSKKKAKSQRRQLDERLAKIGKKRTSDRDGENDRHAERTECGSNKLGAQHTTEKGTEAPAIDAAQELARLDEMIMPPTRSPSPQAAAAPSPVPRQLQRVVSETNSAARRIQKRLPGDPVRYTPSPKPKSPSTVAQKEPAPEIRPPPRPVTAVPPKTRSKNSLQRSVSLNTTSNGTSTVILGRPFKAPKSPVSKESVPEKPPDPWSREAFDLFTWRPPGWDEEGWCLKVVDAAVEVIA